MSGYIGSKRSSSLVSATEITLDGAKLKSSGDSITKSDGTTAVLSESSGTVTFTTNTAVIEGSSSGDLVRVTQTGSGNALVVEDSANPDSTPFVVDASGRIVQGHTSILSIVGNSSNIQQHGLTSQSSTISSVRWQSANAAGPQYTFGKSRSGTVGSYSVLSSGDVTGVINFAGDDGSTLVIGASIVSAVDGTPGTNDMPGRLVFSTTADGSSSPTERMRISSTGVTRFTRNTSSANDFLIECKSDVGGVGSTVLIIRADGDVQNVNNSYGAISDIKLKENIVDANSQWDDLKALQIRNYNLKEGQTHTQIGLIAQEVELICPGLVSESPDRDEEGNDLGTATKSVNYSVLYMKAVKALQEAMDRIESQQSQIDALTAKTQEQDLTIASLISRIEALETQP